MSEARVEAQQRPASGAALLVLVGLGVAFALIVALLAAAKTHSGPIYGEANMLYAALVLYAGAATLYMGYGVTGIERYVSTATVSDGTGICGQYRGGGTSLVGCRPSAVLQHVRDAAELRLDSRPADPDCRAAYKVKIIDRSPCPLRWSR